MVDWKLEPIGPTRRDRILDVTIALIGAGRLDYWRKNHDGEYNPEDLLAQEANDIVRATDKVADDE